MNITRPTFYIEIEKVLENISLMAEKAQKSGVRFRPHFKTHQSAEIGNWFREYGVTAITVSSVEMAGYFAAHDWKDITIAFPFNLFEVDQVNELASEIHINLLLENLTTAHFLEKKLENSVGIFIKIDTGTHRTGILPHQKEILDELIHFIRNSQVLNLKGLLTHAGNNYELKGKDAILANHKKSIAILNEVARRYRSLFPNLQLSIGDTPGCSLADDFKGVDEIRPGNFIFYDLMQLNLGTCSNSRNF